MITLFIFYVSGGVVTLLLLAKIWESKSRRSLSFLRIISKGDERFRNFYHDFLHEYVVFKEKTEFFFRKQIPLHSKNILNKTETLINERMDKYLGDIRNSRFLEPKNEGISEFFKTMKEMETETSEAIKDMDTPGEKTEGVLDTKEKKI